jgi:micrococcal nuclease
MTRKKIKLIIMFPIIYMLGFISGYTADHIFQSKEYLKPDNTISKAIKTAPNSLDAVDVKVVRVIDGDTIEIEGGERVRYIGINTPELKDPRGLVSCFAKEATDENRRLIEGKTVRLEKDISDRDKYGRLLRYVYAGDVFINQILVGSGYAKATTYPPDIKYQELFLSNEQSARQKGLGLWKKCGT